MPYSGPSTLDSWLVDWEKMPKVVNYYSDGGSVKGQPGLDKVQVESKEPGGAMINYSEGEYVIPKDVVRALGRGTFDDIIAAFHSPILGETS